MNTYVSILIITALIGLLNTLYLSYCTLMQKPVACWFLPEEWCRKVQYSPHSRTFGIPNPYLGLIMISLILILTYLFLQSVVPFWIIFAVITAGFLFSNYFTYVQIVIIKALCTWCVLSALVFTVLFIASSLQMKLVYASQ
jgi:uncharacterized membrane protein